MRRRSTFVLLFALFASLLSPLGQANAATSRSRVAQIPSSPTSQDSVRVWMNSDTAPGETAGIEYLIAGSYTKVLGTYDTSYAGANWRADIPAQANGTTVSYQLFTRNQSGSDYGFTGFSWSYTVNDGDIQWAGLRHDTFDSYYRSPFGAVTAGTPVTLRFRTIPLDVTGVSVRVYQYDPATQTTSAAVDYPMTYLQDRVENGISYAIWTLTLTTPSLPAILYYKFRISDQLDVDWYSDAYADNHDNLNQGGEGAASDNEPDTSFQITAYDPAFQTPSWLQNANVYQIFPDRFRNGDPTNDYCVAAGTTGCPTFYGTEVPIAHTTWNEAIYDPRQAGTYFNAYGNQFFGGDLQGIIQKLDYLQSLGIDTLYLTPIFTARSNHRYDTDNYMQVDPALGGDAAFAALTQELNRRGMHLILDGVFNHTSSDSLYFDRYHRYTSDGACEATSSSFYNWYHFTTGTTCATGNYEGWFGYDSLAVLTDDSAAVRDYIYRNSSDNVVKHWYDQGASGWRFDVADEISHNWWRDFRGYAKTWNSTGPLVGEVWYDASQYLLGDQLDSVMNYRFRKNILGFARGGAQWNDNDSNGSNNIVALSPSQFDHALRSVREDYPPQATAAMLNLVDSHDTNRALYVLTLLGDTGLTEAKERLKLTALFQFSYLGAPMIYYGDEAAINAPSLANGTNGPEDDPYNRAPYPWADESGDTSVYGPADSAVLSYYSQLAHLRQQHAALRTGSFETLLTGDTSASTSDNSSYAFARVGGGETAIVALNNGSGSNTASIPVSAYVADGAQLQDALSGTIYIVSGGNVSVTLAARSGAILFASPSSADTTAPSASITLSPAANSNGWNNSSPVTANLSASDSGSGVKELRYWQNSGSLSIASGSTASVSLSTDNTTVNLRAVDNAGNISALASTTVRIDTATPSISASSSPEANSADWNKTAVTVSFLCSDTLSGIDSCAEAQTLSGEGSNQSATGTATDKAGNTASATASGINIDTTAPTTSANPPSGWSISSVTLTLVPNDNLSGVAATHYTVDGGAQQSGTTVTINGDGDHTVSFWSVDVAGNVETATSLTIQIDSSAPTITYLPLVLDPWYNSDVTITFSCSAPSGIASCTGPQTVTTEGQNQAVSGSAVSNSGNANVVTALVSIDKTAPTISGAATTSPNGAGWYNSNVTVHFTCSDALSGIASCPADATLTSEGSSLSATGTATDAADNSAGTTVSGIKIDKTAPVTGASSTLSGTTATVTLSANDALSGVASTSYKINAGAFQSYTAPFTISGAGTYTISFSSRDNAGNVEATKSYNLTITAPSTAIQPILACVKASKKNTYIAWFGYRNDGNAVIIPIGNNNKFSPKPINRGQPSSFASGLQSNVFSVAFDGKNITWTVKGPDGVNRSATASKNSPRCP